MFNKTWKKCIFVFIIIFMVILVGGALTINYLHDTVVDNNIHPVTVMVTDKYYDDKENSYHYSVITDSNKTLSIVDYRDSHGEELWQKIIVGKRYRFIVKEPELTNVNHFTNIIQVYNTTE